MIVLSEYTDDLPASASRNDLRRAEEIARLLGLRVVHLPQQLPSGFSVDDALWTIERAPAPEAAIWSGYIPTPERYAEVHAALVARNVHLPNAPDQHLRAQELDRAIGALAELTPQTVVVRAEEDFDAAADLLGFPLFLKGTVQSAKSFGAGACIARDRTQLRELGARLLRNAPRARGRVLVREFVALRHGRTHGTGLPMGREFRCFVLCGEVLGLGYYWEGSDPLASLSPEEERAVRELATEAARRIAVPYVAVDIGQLEDGRWIVIETGDGQFSGLAQIPPMLLWSGLVERSWAWLPMATKGR